ncbi:hypothetical protein [Aliiroseovarius sp. YM-037]|uniref:hypothetical protein n=1 Tax=Aliiroseovarius sp. YM-037 TaxID=3341728 RepID=UPI003A7F7C87
MLIIYFAISFAALAMLCHVIWKLGSAIGDCPQAERAAKVAAMTILTGFAMIASALVTFIAAGLLFAMDNSYSVLFLAIGGAMMVLGLGFTQAAAMLREVVYKAINPDPKPAAPISDLAEGKPA